MLSNFAASLLRNEVPTDWRLLSAGAALVDSAYGVGDPGSSAGDIDVIGMKDLKNGYVTFTDLGRIAGSLEDYKAYKLEVGDILLNRTNSADLVGKVGIVAQPTAAIFASYLVRLRVDKNTVDPFFLAQWLNSDVAQRALKRIATRAVSQANINPTEFKKQCPVPLPPLSEQRKIVEILRTWDKAIEACERQREVKINALTAARHRVFGLHGYPPAKWPSSKLEVIVDRVRRLADGADHPVMTISGKSGFKRQDEKFDRFMAGESVSRYLLLERGEFAYNKGNSKTYPQGCIYRLAQDTALVPFVYFAFALRDGLNSDFYVHLFEAGFLNHQLSRLINSGVRNDGLLNIYADDFFGCVVPVPPEPEQARVAAFFNLAKQELAALDREIEALRMQKRGLMQKLLTGQWRVKAEKETAHG